MHEDDTRRLLEAIAAGRLVAIVGAGLSMAPPSSLPSAAAVAKICAEGYAARVGTPLAAELHADIEALARQLRQADRFASLFIGELVPWARFKEAPNAGHEAIADFLACGLLHFGVTTNFDELVECAAERLGEPDFRAMVDLADLAKATPHRPLMKIHGCAGRTRDRTVWCREQLEDPAVKATFGPFLERLRPELRGRDLLFVGFWSDWGYLADTLVDLLPAGEAQHVYLVDPAPDTDLQAKAPALWAWAHQPGVRLHRIQESGATALDELRAHWSRLFLARAQEDAAGTYRGLLMRDPAPPPHDHRTLSSSTLYALRRDLSGTPATEIVRDRTPQVADRAAVALHRRIMELGGTYESHTHTFAGQRIRILSARGDVLSEVRARFRREAPMVSEATTVVCAGALSDVSPSDLIRDAETPDLVRSGSASRWTTHDDLLSTLRAMNG